MTILNPSGHLVPTVLLTLSLASFVAGCGEDSTASSSPPKQDAGAEAGALTWTPEAASAGTAVYLGDATMVGDKLRVPIQGKEIGELYGVAFRLVFDASVLTFDGLSKGDAWTAGGDVVYAKQATPGLLVGVVSSKGATAGVKVDDGTLGWLDFTMVETTPSAVQFVPGRCAIVRPDGSELDGVQWSGGALAAP